MKIIVSRTDSIGDVVLTLPVTGILKNKYPQCKILFFGRTYTQPVINACEYVDEFIDYDEFEKLDKHHKKIFLSDLQSDVMLHVYPRADIAMAAKEAGIKHRIGTRNRVFHWLTCNNLVSLSRKNSILHEAQLNIKLLQPLGIKRPFETKELYDYFGMTKIKPLNNELKKYLSDKKLNIILHPKSNASGREWSTQHYKELIEFLPGEKFNFIITGTEKEKLLLGDLLKSLPDHAHDAIGKMDLQDFISFINSSDGLVAAGTGPLHIAAALGKHALGIFPPIRPIDPIRWRPVGKNADYLVVDKSCSDCRKSPALCHCINEVTAAQVAEKISQWADKKL